PSLGPTAGPTIIPSPKTAAANVCSCGGNDSNRIACDVAINAPPPSPCTIRQTTSSTSDDDWPQRNEAIVKMMIDAVKYRRRPKYDDSQPVMGSTITAATI